MSKLQEAKDLLATTEGHTPGPWALAQYGPCLWDVVPDDGPGRIARRVCQDTNNLGDASLIAAAPALRDLLAAMVAEVEGARPLIEEALGWAESESDYDLRDRCRAWLGGDR